MPAVPLPSGSVVILWTAVQDMERNAATGQLTDLVYELLDAHADTIDLAGALAEAPAWAAHLDYLRDLQRVSREALASQRL